MVVCQNRVNVQPTISEHQMQLLAMITKRTVIMLTLFILVVLFYIIEIIWIDTARHRNDTLYGMLEAVSLDIISVCCELCVFMTLRMNATLYSFVCKSCDSKLGQVCEAIAVYLFANSITHTKRESLKKDMQEKSVDSKLSLTSTIRMPSVCSTKRTENALQRASSVAAVSDLSVPSLIRLHAHCPPTNGNLSSNVSPAYTFTMQSVASLPPLCARNLSMLTSSDSEEPMRPAL
eukprot:CAMPEP_0197077204 /NCGR_PEP_ID=MMETSP1384-20130603/212501_1 /TAXON_ID=29189 /ORGANISM="Ammonia sp." /LENGTH=233 /DNA_ID=CAMNT_0042516065 /DNA_START=460 /DNA_END=1161 /DNA_ORIENTATION=+